MSNEELVAAIQAGAEERMEELWLQMRPFIVWRAKHVMSRMETPGILEMEDLIQSGYFGLYAAVRSYKSDRGGFYNAPRSTPKNRFCHR